jgi:hypothetical protein
VAIGEGGKKGELVDGGKLRVDDLGLPVSVYQQSTKDYQLLQMPGARIFDRVHLIRQRDAGRNFETIESAFSLKPDLEFAV